MALPLAALAAVGRGIIGAAPKIAAGASRTAAFTETAGNAAGRMITRSAVSGGGSDDSKPTTQAQPASTGVDLSESVARTAEFQIGQAK
jgi:hypothetical protein